MCCSPNLSDGFFSNNVKKIVDGLSVSVFRIARRMLFVYFEYQKYNQVALIHILVFLDAKCILTKLSVTRFNKIS
jgi:hypothetical protein